MTRFSPRVVIACGLIIGIAATTSTISAQTLATPSAPPSMATASLAGTGDASYASRAGLVSHVPDPRDMLYPGDIVRLKIYREPDLSGDYDVNVHGEAVFPKIGTVHVTDMTIDSLQRLLVSTYSEYLRDPAIEITPLRRVTVLGAVKNPGLYPVDPTMSISDALALAGGPTPDGNQKHLELIRSGKKKYVTVAGSTKIADTEIRSGDELFVPERSWIARNGYIVGALIGAVAVVGTTMLTINH